MPAVHIYVDESGDLGFTDKSSKFFTIGYVFTVNRYPFVENTTVKRLLKNINSGNKKHHRKLTEFKFSQDSERVRKKFLCKIQKMDIIIGTVCINKNAVRDYLRSDPNFLYRYLVVDSIITILVEEYFKKHDPYNSIRFVIDRSLSKTARLSFNKYCEDKMSFRSYERDREMESQVYIRHENSQSVQMLQVADYIAGSVQRRFEREDSQFYDIIRDKIKHKRSWDWDDKIKW